MDLVRWRVAKPKTLVETARVACGWFQLFFTLSLSLYYLSHPPLLSCSFSARCVAVHYSTHTSHWSSQLLLNSSREILTPRTHKQGPTRLF
jgi:hypothetical protein